MAPVGVGEPPSGSVDRASWAVPAGTPTAATPVLPSPITPSDTGTSPSPPSFHSWYSSPSGSWGRSSTST